MSDENSTIYEREILFRGFCADENGNKTIFVNGEAIKGLWVEGYLLQRNIIETRRKTPRFSHGDIRRQNIAKFLI